MGTNIRERILVAEDNLVSQRVITHMLDGLGYHPVCCGTGKQAVALCLSSNYACVLMDGFMPEMDGMEAAREIRRLERGRRTPIVALTASLKDEDRRHCLAGGMDDFLVKPVKMSTLGATLEYWIQAGARRAGAATSGV